MDLRKTSPHLIIFFLLLNSIEIFGLPARRQVINFDFDWKFNLGDITGASKEKFKDAEWRQLDLPHDWSIEQEFDENLQNGRRNAWLSGGVGWYRKHFELKDIQDKQVYIQFDGVYHQSDVYINGKRLGFRPYGYVSFLYDLTPHLKKGENVIAVRVDHSNAPSSRWYSGSGIYRHVKLIITSPMHVEPWGTYVTTDKISKESAHVDIHTTVINKNITARDCHLETVIKDSQGKVAAKVSNVFNIVSGGTHTFDQQLTIQNPRLWSIDSPELYTAESNVYKDQDLVDTYITTFGVRDIRFDAQKGFFINDKNVLLKGMNLHQDAGCVGTAVPDRVWERRLEKVKSLGCNAIRMSHNPPAPEILDMCDRMGFIVIDEAFDKWKSMYYESYFDDWWQADVEAMLKRDRNHPSIVLWSVGNEVSEASKPEGVKRLKMLVDFVHKYEPSRLVTCVVQPSRADDMNPSGFAEAMDVVGYNYMEPWYKKHKAEYPKRIMFGAECYPFYRGREYQYKAFVPDNPWYDAVENEFVFGYFMWAGIDYLGESSGWPSKGWPTGIINTCGYIKPNAWFFKSQWKPEEPLVRITVQYDGLDMDHGKAHWSWPKLAEHWTFPELTGQVLRVETPTNCETVELLLNGFSYGEKKTSDYTNSTVVWYVPYASGTLQAIGRNKGEISASHVLESAGDVQRILVSIDRKELKANGQDVAHLNISLVDAEGRLVPNADRLLTLKINGPGRLIGFDNGDLRSNESYKANTRTSYWGRALAIVQSHRSPGRISVNISAEGVEDKSVVIRTEE